MNRVVMSTSPGRPRATQQIAEHALLRREMESRAQQRFWHVIPRWESSAGLGDPVEQW